MTKKDVGKAITCVGAILLIAGLLAWGLTTMVDWPPEHRTLLLIISVIGLILVLIGGYIWWRYKWVQPPTLVSREIIKKLPRRITHINYEKVKRLKISDWLGLCY